MCSGDIYIGLGDVAAMDMARISSAVVQLCIEPQLRVGSILHIIINITFEYVMSYDGFHKNRFYCSFSFHMTSP